MKILTYKIVGYTRVYNPETEEVEQHESIATVVAECRTQANFDAAYPIAEKEAIPGSIEVSGEFDPEPGTPSGDDSSVWDDLDAAYQEGYDEGYTEGVNSAYDQ